LAKSPSQIKLGDVVRFIDGPIEPLACVERGYAGCKDIYKCIFRNIWQETTRCISDVIDKITFENLAKQVRSQKETLVYQI